jgi:hypothetical protein
MPPAAVLRGPCKVRAQGCAGEVASKNTDHPGWKWRKAEVVGTLRGAPTPLMVEIPNRSAQWTSPGDSLDDTHRLQCNVQDPAKMAHSKMALFQRPCCVRMVHFRAQLNVVSGIT